MAKNRRSAKANLPDGHEPRHIQSVTFGFRLIQCLEAAPMAMSLKEIAQCVDMPPSHAHLYMASFKKVGLVRQDASTSRYSLGPYALQLGLAAIRKLDVVEIAKEPMYELQRQTGETVYLSVWGNQGPTIVAKVDGARPIPVTTRIGYVLPLLTTATGRIFLTYLPRHETAPLIRSGLATSSGARRKMSITSDSDLDKIVNAVRNRGLAQTDSLLSAGFVGLSAPIFDHTGDLRAAITLMGPSGLVDFSFRGHLAGALKATALDLSIQLGFREAGSRASEK